MSSRKTNHFWNSLSFRLTLWYAGIFAVSSFVAFLLFYAFITSVIQERTDQELLDQGRQFSVILREQGIDAVKSYAVLEAQGAGVKKVFFRLLYPTGQAFSSSIMAYWKDIAVSKRAVEQLLSGNNRVFETVVLSARRDQVRILYAVIGPGVILQVGQSMENYVRIIDAFRGIFLVTMALLIGLAAGVGWFMARRAVSGVETITRTARDISAGALEKRVPVGRRGDEIDQLAMTFNHMLNRVELLVTEIRQMGDNIAHDLKSPITRIRGMSEVTLTMGKSLSEYEAMAGGIIEECDRLLDMINTMLMISKTEAGVEKHLKEKIDLVRLVRDACALFGTMAQDKGLKLDCDVLDRCEIAGDRRLLQRMLSNLLDNAIKYTPPGGKVLVAMKKCGGDKVKIAVEDTGIGISAGDLPHIFERFYRGDRSRSEPGAGLGLSLARAIARAHGGDITAQSHLHEGSLFIAILPLST